MKTIEAVVVILIVALGASLVLNYSLYASNQQLSSAFNNLNQSYTDFIRNEVTNSIQPHSLTNEEIAQLFPNLLTANQLWNSGTCTWINTNESQTGVNIHWGSNNSSEYFANDSPSNEIKNYTAFLPNFFNGEGSGYYAYIWLQYNDSIWVETSLNL